jgi:hypothetical protein
VQGCFFLPDIILLLKRKYHLIGVSKLQLFFIRFILNISTFVSDEIFYFCQLIYFFFKLSNKSFARASQTYAIIVTVVSVELNHHHLEACFVLVIEIFTLFLFYGS